jgi:serine phosphatase RsbU (regulator of sigma subunit)
MAEAGTPAATGQPLRSEAVPSAALLDALFAEAPLGLAFCDRELRFRRINPELAAMNGLPVEAHLGHRPSEVLPGLGPQLEATIRRVLDSGEALRDVAMSGETPSAPGVTRHWLASYLPVRDGSARLVGVAGLVVEVTDERHAAMRADEAMGRHALEREQSRLLREALLARAQAEAAEVRADHAREEAERARRDAERARGRIGFLARAGREMAEPMDLDATVRAVVRSAVPAVADWAELTIAEPNGRLRVVAVAHSDPQCERLARERAAREPLDAGATAGPANVVRTGELEVVEDAEHGVQHRAIAPLRTPAGIIGTLSLMLVYGHRRFSPDDLDLIASFAARASLHIQNARLYTERSHIARTLQASLRPRALPTIPGADIAARFRPAGDQNEVGGDFYDVFPSGEAVWTAIVGDVSGKGAKAAAFTALARHTLRTASMLHDDPAANLALLDRVVHADSPASDFCTVFYARICPGAAGLDLRFANGGHPPPLVLRADGTVEHVQSGRGPLVGGVQDARFETARLRLAPGDLLVVYTDGVTEVRTSDIALGERELQATVAAHAGASADELVSAIERRAVELQAGAPRDDIALLAVRAAAPSAGASP